MLNHVLPRTNKLYASGTFGKEVVCRIKCLFAWSVGIFDVALMIFRIDKICLNCVFCKKCKYEWMRVRCNKLEPRLIFIWNLVTIKRQIHNTKCYFSRIDCYMVTPPLNAFTLSNKLNSKCLFSVFDSIIWYIRFIQVTVDWREGSASGASKKKEIREVKQKIRFNWWLSHFHLYSMPSIFNRPLSSHRKWLTQYVLSSNLISWINIRYSIYWNLLKSTQLCSKSFFCKSWAAT